MENVFEASAAQLEKLRQKVYEAGRRSKGAEQVAARQKASADFFAAYDRLAFPGPGLTREFELLANGDAEAIELAVRFLEANPWYFRSGYHKENIARLLKKQILTNGQSERLRKVILQRVQGPGLREMRNYGHLASKVNTPEFEAELKNLANSSDHRTTRNAQIILRHFAPEISNQSNSG